MPALVQIMAWHWMANSSIAPRYKYQHGHYSDNERDGISNHWHLNCLFDHLLRCRSKTTSKLCTTGLCEGNPPWPVDSPHKGPVMWKMFPFNTKLLTLFQVYSTWEFAGQLISHQCNLYWNTNFLFQEKKQLKMSTELCPFCSGVSELSEYPLNITDYFFDIFLLSNYNHFT